VKRRILFAIVAVAAAAVVALALPLTIGAARLYREDELLSLERDATAAARGFDVRAQPGDPVEFGPSSDALAAYDRAGELLGGTGPARADATVAQTLASGRVTDLSDGNQLVVAVPILASERVVGAVRAARSTAELSERVLRMRLTVGGVALLIIGLAAAVALALTRRLTKPISDLAAAAAEIDDGRTTTRSPRSGIAELDTVAAALDDTVARLTAVVARERTFSADASHQLRTPLAALRLELESRQLAGGDVQEPLRQVERLEATIETLLAAARDLETEREPFDVAPVLEELRRSWTGLLAEQGRPLEIVAERDLPRVRAAPGAVREILGVLIDNAARHGGGVVRIEARPLDGSVALDVSDEGPGLDDPGGAFTRRSGEGHGIGLALARSLAEADNGRLDLAAYGPGMTRFTLLLRAEDGDDASVG
jgi:signal transduction histidine kinase